MEKKVLIITYYWPPSGGSGVQRWLKFVKYLPHFHWEPIVFTPDKPSFAIRDESLLKDIPPEAEVIHFPIWEPYEAFFKLSGILGTKKMAKPTDLVSGQKTSLFQKISTWIRGNLFIPDPRIFWVRPSVSFLSDFIRDNGIRTIITTGPPHSVHLIGYRLKKKDPSLRWLADFRDPWSEWGLWDSLNVGKFARAVHRRLEGKVLRAADTIVTITPFYVRRFSRLSGRKVELLTNGYDKDDFVDLKPQRTARFTIRHVGIVNEKCDPRPFMEGVWLLLKEHPEYNTQLLVDFTGEVHNDFKNYILQIPELSRITSLSPAVPHKELMTVYGRSSLLLLVLTGYKDAEGYLPGKLFEYLATGLPVLGVGPVNGDAAKLLAETGGGIMVEEDPEKIKAYLLEYFLAWMSDDAVPLHTAELDRYSRKAITGQLVKLLD